MIYGELVAAIGAWLNRPDVEPSIPTFITLAEAHINRRLAEGGFPSAVQRATASIDGEYAAAPTGLVRLEGARQVGGAAIGIVSPQSLDALCGAATGERGSPRNLALCGGERPLRFWPTPDRAYEVELTYVARLEPVGPDEATNWVLAAHPDVYLYGALLQSAPFLGEDGRLATWGALHAEALNAMMSAEDSARGPCGAPQFRSAIPNRGVCR